MYKKTLHTISALVLMIITTASCSKEYPATPIPAPALPLSKIEYDSSRVEIAYDTAGRVTAVDGKSASGIQQLHYAFSYASGKISEINFGGSWKYNYTGSQATTIGTVTETGILKHET